MRMASVLSFELKRGTVFFYVLSVFETRPGSLFDVVSVSGHLRRTRSIPGRFADGSGQSQTFGGRLRRVEPEHANDRREGQQNQI